MEMDIFFITAIIFYALGMYVGRNWYKFTKE